MRSDLWQNRECSICEDPQMGEHWRTEWGCEAPTTNVIRLDEKTYVDRCPRALLKDTPYRLELNWVHDALNAWESHNAVLLGELSAAGQDALYTAIAALRDRQSDEHEKRMEESRSQQDGKGKRPVHHRSNRRR